VDNGAEPDPASSEPADSEPASSEPAGSRQLLRRLRQLAMIVVFDLGGPLAAYSLLRSAGMSALAALVTSGILPATGIAIGAWADRRLDVMADARK